MSPEPSLGQAVLLHRRPAGGALPPERGRKEGPPSSGQERTTGQWEESSLATLGTFPRLSHGLGHNTPREQSLGGFLSVSPEPLWDSTSSDPAVVGGHSLPEFSAVLSRGDLLLCPGSSSR